MDAIAVELISVNNRMPPLLWDGISSVDVLAWIQFYETDSDGNDGCWQVARTTKVSDVDEWWADCEIAWENARVTHWMPLPAPAEIVGE